jgi:hypothetical protein
MFLFIPAGMLVSLVLYQRLVNLSTRVRLPGIIPKRLALTDPENNIVVGLSAWYAIYFIPGSHEGPILVSVFMTISLFWFAWCAAQSL